MLGCPLVRPGRIERKITGMASYWLRLQDPWAGTREGNSLEGGSSEFSSWHHGGDDLLAPLLFFPFALFVSWFVSGNPVCKITRVRVGTFSGYGIGKGSQMDLAVPEVAQFPSVNWNWCLPTSKNCWEKSRQEWWEGAAVTWAVKLRECSCPFSLGVHSLF